MILGIALRNILRQHNKYSLLCQPNTRHGIRFGIFTFSASALAAF